MNEETNTSGESTTSGAKAQASFRARLDDFEKTVRGKVEEVDKMFRDAVRSAVPEDVAKHMSNSKREFLLGIRRMIDREIEKTEKQQENPTAPDTGRQA
jgi:hypothetical protein